METSLVLPSTLDTWNRLRLLWLGVPATEADALLGAVSSGEGVGSTLNRDVLDWEESLDRTFTPANTGEFSIPPFEDVDPVGAGATWL